VRTAFVVSPRLRTTYTQQSNVVQGAIGLGDTFVGVQNPWGKVKFGTTYAPYKKSTDRLNPFSGMLGDYAVVMGNSGGDNRVEFGTRLDHSVWYESPTIGNVFSFDLLISPGQNRTFDNVVQSAGSPDCNGGNEPGSGNLLLNCDDGGFGTAYSADLKFESGGFYGTVAYELHRDVNRNSDGIGSSNPIYNHLFSHNSSLLDFNTFNALSMEFPGYSSVATPGYLTDIGDEAAFKHYRRQLGRPNHLGWLPDSRILNDSTTGSEGRTNRPAHSRSVFFLADMSRGLRPRGVLTAAIDSRFPRCRLHCRPAPTTDASLRTAMQEFQ
jgi:hypothetical protein